MTMWDGEICKVCGCEQRIAWSVKDEVWSAVVPQEISDSTLCLECFFWVADKRRVPIKKEDFNYLAVATDAHVGRPIFIAGESAKTFEATFEETGRFHSRPPPSPAIDQLVELHYIPLDPFWPSNWGIREKEIVKTLKVVDVAGCRITLTSPDI